MKLSATFPAPNLSRNLNPKLNLFPTPDSELRTPKEIRNPNPEPKCGEFGIRAFTLIEVMIAVGIFFVALIAILGVMTRGLSAARGLQISGPDAGMLAAELSITNQLQDSRSESGDFGDHYPGFTWERETYQIASNGLFEVDFFVFKKTDRGPVLYDALSIWLYKPDSPKSEVSRPVFTPRGDIGFRDR